MAKKTKAAKKKVHFIPKGYHSVTPYLACKDAARAEIRIGEYPDMDFFGPQTRGGTTVSLHVYVREVDGMLERAVAAGAKLLRPAENKFYG